MRYSYVVSAQEIQETVLVLGRAFLLEFGGAAENEETEDLGDEDEFHYDNEDHHQHGGDNHDIHDEEDHPSEAGGKKPWDQVVLAACLFLIKLGTLLSAVVFITGEFVAKHVFSKA